MSSETLARMGRRGFLRGGIALGALAGLDISAEATPMDSDEEDRKFWLQVLAKVSDPVLNAASQRRLKELMPVEAPHGNVSDRRQFTYLEALGRLLCGIAPWLESGIVHRHRRERSEANTRIWRAKRSMPARIPRRPTL